MKTKSKVFSVLFAPFRMLKHKQDKIKLNKLFNNINLNKIDLLNGYEFEFVIATLFENMGYAVNTTPKSKDNGVDILAELKSNKIVIQSKLYYKHNVGNKAIQEVYSGKDFYNANIAIVITNSHFTPSAIKLANKLNVVLIDREGLQNLIENTSRKNLIYINKLITK